MDAISPSPAPTILVVDDNALGLKAAVRILQQAGYTVAQAAAGTEALRQVRALRPALVLLDVVMPDISGTEVLRQIRADPDLAGVAVVLFSAQLTQSDQQAAGLDAGADGYIIRPISNQELVARVRSQLRQRELTVQLRASEAQYRRLFEAAKDGILILNAETGMIEDVNPFLTELLGFTRAEVLQRKVWELGCFKHLIANQEKFAELQRVGYARYEDLPLETAEGRKVDVEFVSNVYEVNGAKVVQCNIRNITERKRSEEELRWKTALLEAEVDATLDGILVVDSQGKKILQNQRMIDLWKLPPAIATDSDDANALDHAFSQARNPEAFLAKVRHLYAHPDEVSEDEIELKDGTVLDRYSSPVRGKDGQHYGRIWAFRDITQRKQAEQALRASEEKYKGLFEKTRDAIMTLGPPDWRFTSGNPAAVQLFGAKDEAEFVAHGPADASPARQPDGASSAEKAGRMIAKAMRDGSHFFEWTHRRLGGVEFLADVLLTRVVLGDGTKMLHATVRDITERKQAEQALREKEHLLSESQRLGHVGSWFLDAAGAMAWSEEMYHIYGVSPATFTPSAEALLQLMHPDDRSAMQAWISACAAGAKPGNLEFRITQPDGTVRYIMGRGEVVHDAANNFLHMAGTAQDITRDKLAQAERMRLTRQMELLLESTDQGINGMDLAGRCTFINRAGAEMFRCTPAEALGQDMHAMVHHHKADGSPYPAAECPTLDVFRRDQSCHLDTEVFWRRDGTSFPVDYSSHPIREDGVIAGAVVTFNDITEKKKLAAEFLRSQRMEGIGALAGGIAHDLNNALAPILMSVEILKLTNTDPEKCRILDTIYDCARRGANMVKQILTFARGTEGERGVVQPRHLVQEMIDMTRHTFPKAIQIRTAVAPNIWTLLGNPTQLHQILLNLCVNARDAMPAGGTLTLAAENVLLDATGAEVSPDAKPGPYVALTVKDTGTGMTPEVRARLFEAFFTTKAPGKGTGLGLTTVHNIAKEHGGFLTVDSEVGRGSTFKVFLPAQPDAVAAAAPTERPALPMGNGELILVVDDEAVIRSIAQQTLEAYGYRVVTAEDGAQAVGVCAASDRAPTAHHGHGHARHGRPGEHPRDPVPAAPAAGHRRQRVRFRRPVGCPCREGTQWAGLSPQALQCGRSDPHGACGAAPGGFSLGSVLPWCGCSR